jgi:hypothetical protein
LKIFRRSQIFGYLYSSEKVMHQLCQKMNWATFFTNASGHPIAHRQNAFTFFLSSQKLLFSTPRTKEGPRKAKKFCRFDLKLPISDIVFSKFDLKFPSSDIVFSKFDLKLPICDIVF